MAQQPTRRLFAFGALGKVQKPEGTVVALRVPRIKTFFAALGKGHFWSDFLLFLNKMLNNAFPSYVGD